MGTDFSPPPLAKSKVKRTEARAPMTTNTAQLAIFKAPGAPFEFAERPLPACGEGEALVAIFPLFLSQQT